MVARAYSRLLRPVPRPERYYDVSDSRGFLFMKVLVTGGAGYLGSIVVRLLVEDGHDVVVLDNFLYGRGPIEPFVREGQLTLVQGDIRDLETVARSLEGANAVIHLAAIVGDQAGDLDGRQTMAINYLSAKNIAELCVIHDVPAMAFASSCSVYGVRPDGLLDEDSPVAPISLYGETKARTEDALLSLADEVAVTVLRLGTLCGSSYRMRFDLAVNLFVARAYNHEPIEVYGGMQRRPFIDVKDAANVFVRAVEHGHVGVFNTAAYNVSVLEVVGAIGEHFPSLVVHTIDAVTDPRDYAVSSDRMGQAFGKVELRSLGDSISDIRRLFDSGAIENYKDSVYSNFRALHSQRRVHELVHTKGVIF